MPTTVRAAWELVTGQAKSFERTPKFGVANSDEAWVTKRYQLKLDRWFLFGLGIAVWNLGTLLYCIEMQNWVIGFYAGVFFVGSLFVSGLNIAQNVQVRRYQRKTVQTQMLPDVTA